MIFPHFCNFLIVTSECPKVHFVTLRFKYQIHISYVATQERYEKQLSELSGRGRCDSTLEEGDITHALSETETQEQESEKQGKSVFLL